jgi:putative chitinase
MNKFFDVIRREFGPLAQNQVDGINTLLKASKDLPLKHRAYLLATAWHETGPASSPLHMTPRREIWGPTAAQKRYEGRVDLGNTVSGDGKRFMGRGYVQITGRTNYAKASKLVGKDLVGNPDLALVDDIAAAIIVDGMKHGWFTGKKMSDYSTYKGMRRVVNGTDKDTLIAGYAEKFEDALVAMGLEVSEPPKPVAPPPPPPPVEVPTPEVEAEKEADKTIAGWLIGIIAFLIAAAAAWIVKGS